MSDASSEASVVDGLAHIALHYDDGRPARSLQKHHQAMHSALHASDNHNDSRDSQTNPRRTSLRSSVGSVDGNTGAKDREYWCPCWSQSFASQPQSNSTGRRLTEGLLSDSDHDGASENQRRDDHGYYEVLFGGSPSSHETFDPERRLVDKLLESNPSTFPSLCPDLDASLVTVCVSTAALLLGWWLCPGAWLKHLPGAPGSGEASGGGGGGVEGFRLEVLAYASIPLVSCLFTYFHIWLALWMMFFPIRFVGCWRIPGTNLGFPVGWQGIVPFKAVRMVGIATDLILDRLIDLKTEFRKVKPEMVASLLEAELLAECEAIYPAIALKHKPQLWERLPDAVKQQVVARGAAQAKGVVMGVMGSMQEHLTELVDLKKLVTAHFLENPSLLNGMFIQCGYKVLNELIFIRNNGATLGFLFGFLQMIVWIFWHPKTEAPLQASTQGLVVFPLFGLLVGAATNWLSLLVIFSPIDPIDLGALLGRCLGGGGCGGGATEEEEESGQEEEEGKEAVVLEEGGGGAGVCGCCCCCDSLLEEGAKKKKKKKGGACVLHGLFLRRQKEVSAVYGRLVGKEVLSMPSLVDAMLVGRSVPEGPKALQRLMRPHFVKAFNDSLDAFPQILNSLGINAVTVLGEAEVDAMREDAVARLLAVVPRLMSGPRTLKYFESAIGMEVTLRERMVKLPNKDFEAILHPVFQEDEWKLIAVGGGLGVVIGLLQAFFIN